MKAKKKGGAKDKVKSGRVKKPVVDPNAGRPTRPQKSKKGKRKGQGWNLVPIGEEFFSNKEFENLISFEELVEYDVVSKEDGTKDILVGSGHEKVKKRSAGSEDDDLDDGGAKVKKSKKGKALLASGKAQEVIFTSAGPVIVEDIKEEESIDVANGVELKSDSEGVASKREKKKAKENKEKQQQSKKKLKEKRLKPDRKAKKVGADAEKETDDDGNENTEFDENSWVKLGVPDVILRSLKENKFDRPTNIQTQTLPAALLGKKDIVGAAETGSGKTLAFAIPIIDGILKDRANDEAEDNSNLKALILTPTRELAVQIKKHFEVISNHTDIKTVLIVGGLASEKQERLLRSHPDVVIATAGRLWELLQAGDSHLSTLNQLKYLAIDETDRIVEKGNFEKLEGILNVINTDEIYKAHRQNFVFSATLTFTHEPPQRLKKIGNKKVKFMQRQPKKMSAKDKLKQIMEMVGLRPNPKIVDITTAKGTCETLTELQINCTQDYKDYYLYYFLLCNPGRTIVFCNSINTVRRLTNLFFLLKFGEVLPLHSDIKQKMRLRNLEKFTANDKGVLIATDVAARGLDIQNIQHVIHYHVPKTAEGYIHRSGRTARAFKEGIAILMIEPTETTTVQNIFRSLGRDEMLANFEVDSKTFRSIKSTIELAVKVEQFEHSVKKQLADHNWMQTAKKDMDLATSSDDSDDEGGATSQKKAMQISKKQLDHYKEQLDKMLLTNSSILISNSIK